jgi:hypothetical protein
MGRPSPPSFRSGNLILGPLAHTHDDALVPLDPTPGALARSAAMGALAATVATPVEAAMPSLAA